MTVSSYWLKKDTCVTARFPDGAPGSLRQQHLQRRLQSGEPPPPPPSELSFPHTVLYVRSLEAVLSGIVTQRRSRFLFHGALCTNVSALRFAEGFVASRGHLRGRACPRVIPEGSAPDAREEPASLSPPQDQNATTGSSYFPLPPQELFACRDFCLCGNPQRRAEIQEIVPDVGKSHGDKTLLAYICM